MSPASLLEPLRKWLRERQVRLSRWNGKLDNSLIVKLATRTVGGVFPLWELYVPVSENSPALDRISAFTFILPKIGLLGFF